MTKKAEFDELRKAAEQQFPGVIELIGVYGGYNKTMIEVQRYLQSTEGEVVTTTSNRSEP